MHDSTQLWTLACRKPTNLRLNSQRIWKARGSSGYSPNLELWLVPPQRQHHHHNARGVNQYVKQSTNHNANVLNPKVDRTELNLDQAWAETGDRYMLKLFRDYIFHQVTYTCNFCNFLRKYNFWVGFTCKFWKCFNNAPVLSKVGLDYFFVQGDGGWKTLSGYGPCHY